MKLGRRLSRQARQHLHPPTPPSNLQHKLALIAAGVDKARLVPKAAGPIAPLASNRTPEGQAKNRRVELVEQFVAQ